MTKIFIKFSDGPFERQPGGFLQEIMDDFLKALMDGVPINFYNKFLEESLNKFV